MGDQTEKLARELYRYLLGQAMAAKQLQTIREEAQIEGKNNTLSEFRRSGYMSKDKVNALKGWFINNNYLRAEDDPATIYRNIQQSLLENWTWLRCTHNIPIENAANLIKDDSTPTDEEVDFLTHWEAGDVAVLKADKMARILKQAINWSNPDVTSLPEEYSVEQHAAYAVLLKIDKMGQANLKLSSDKPIISSEEYGANWKYYGALKKRQEAEQAALIQKIELSDEELRILQMYRALNKKRQEKFKKELLGEYLDLKEGRFAKNRDVYLKTKSPNQEEETDKPK